MVLMSFAMLLIPSIDVFAKLLISTMSAGQVVWYRFFLQSLLLTPVIFYQRLWHIPEGTLMTQFARGVLLAAATVFFFAALVELTIAQAISIFFVSPLILTALSALFLGEVIRIRRIVAIIIGFIGALIIIRPTFGDVGAPALYPLGTAFCFAFYFLLTRKLSSRVDPFQMQWMVGVSATVTLGLCLMMGEWLGFTVFQASIPTGIEISWVLGIGVVATIGHLMLVHATRYAEASVLAPFQYLEIISTVIFGFLVFDNIPDQATIIGVSIIIASGFYIFHRENKLRRE
jgi:S-adenosylmethionine uptake transporter